MCARPLALSFGIMLATVAAGLTVRFVPIGLPHLLVKYGGSMLWAVMIYWVVSTLLPSWRISALVLLSGVIATAVEFFKLYSSPAVDAFRLTLPGIILLGSIFSVWDIVAYWIAIAAAALIDHRLRL